MIENGPETDSCIKTVQLTLRSRGISGEQWIKRFTKRGIDINKEARSILLSDQFQPTNKLLKIRILRFTSWKDLLSHKQVREYAKKNGLLTPPPELACLIRSKFSIKSMAAMGLSRIIVMHEPIEMGRIDYVLSACSDYDNKIPFLFGTYEGPGGMLYTNDGFAFLDPEYFP